MNSDLPDNLENIGRLGGHIPKMGKSAGEELNWAYRVKEKESQKKFVAMFCKPNHYTFIDEETWNKLQEDNF